MKTSETFSPSDWKQFIAKVKLAAPMPEVRKWLETVTPKDAVNLWEQTTQLLKESVQPSHTDNPLAHDPARLVPALVTRFVESDSPEETPSAVEFCMLLATLHLAEANAHQKSEANRHLIAYGQATAFALAFPFIDSLVYKNQLLTESLENAKQKRAAKKALVSQSKAKGGHAKSKKLYAEANGLIEKLYEEHHASPEIAGNMTKLAEFIKYSSQTGFRTQTIQKKLYAIKKKLEKKNQPPH